MGASFRASLLLAMTAALGCGGEASGGATDAAARDVATGQDVAADVGVQTEASILDATISDGVAVPDASETDSDATPEASLDTDAGSDAGCNGPNRCGPTDASADGSATAGDASDGGSEESGAAGTCGTGTVTFRLYPGAGGPWQASMSGDEEPDFLAIFTATGTPLYRTSAEFALEDCDCSGQQWPVPIGYEYGDLTDAGFPQTWDGFYFSLGEWPDSGACAVTLPQSRADCLIPGCAPPGEYVAYMCACGGGDASASSGVPSSYAYSVADCANPTCVRVPFEYPSQTVVVGTVSASDQ
jgi:hypothetical protein